MVKQKVSPSGSFEGFDWKTFILGFKKPAIMLLTLGISTLASNPNILPYVAALGGVGVLVERVWAVVEFYVKDIKLN